MDIPNWPLLWFVFSAFISGLLFEVKANPRFSVYNTYKRAYSPVTEKDCFCFDKNPSSKYVPEQINKGNALERLVVYYYKDTKTHEVKMYTPGLEKQHLLPDLALEDDDSITLVTNQRFSDLLNYNPNFIPLNRPRNRGPTDDLPGYSAELYDNQSQRPSEPYDNQSRHPEEPYDIQSQRPAWQYDNQSQRPSGQYDNQSQRPSGQYDSQSQRSSWQYDNQSQRPSRQYDNQSQRPSRQYDNKSQRPSGPYNDKSSYDNQYDDYSKGPFQRPDLSNELESDNVYKPYNQAYVTFGNWFAQQIKRVKQLPVNSDSIDFHFLKNLVQKILKDNGMYVSSDGVLTDNKGNVIDLNNIQLRPVLVGKSVGNDKIRSSCNKVNLVGQDPYLLESVLISLLNPPKILGILPLRQSNLPKNSLGRPGLGFVKYVADLQTRPGLEGVVKYPAHLQTRPNLEGVVKYASDLQNRPGLEGVVKYSPDLQTRPGFEGVVKYAPDFQTRPGLEGVIKYASDLHTHPGLEGVVKYYAPDHQTRPALEGDVKYAPDIQTRPGIEGVIKYASDVQTRPGLEGVVKYASDLQTRPGLDDVIIYASNLQTPPGTERNVQSAQEQPYYPCNKPNCFGPSIGFPSTSTVVPPSSDHVQIQQESYYTDEDSNVEKATVPPLVEKVSDTKELLGLIGKKENELQQNLKDSKETQKEFGVKQFNTKNAKKVGVVLSDGRRAKESIQMLYKTKQQNSKVPKGFGNLQNILKQLTKIVLKKTEDEEKPDFRIIGGNPATSSGNPLSNKGRRNGW